MAFAKGVVTIKEIELDHGVWQVEGRDADGHKIKIEVDATKRRDRQDQAPPTAPRRPPRAPNYQRGSPTLRIFFLPP